jgi:citrate lyase subunit beta / citryl-CoA lyase
VFTISSLLFVPANDERKFQKASLLPCSGIILDLEDAIHASQKEAARKSLTDIVPKHRNPRQTLYVRINGLDTEHWQDDVAAAVNIRPNGVVVPKAHRHLTDLDDYLSALERTSGLEDGTIRLILILETAAAVVDMEEVLCSSPRIDSATIGMADLSADLGTSWEDIFRQEPPLLLSVREKLALLSRKLGLAPPWDSVFMQFKDVEQFRRDAMIGKRLGYQGKHVIHPSQIDIVHEVYQVSEQEYTQAKEILAKMEGLGAVQIEGLLIDEPVVKRARQVISRYEEGHR